MNRTFEPDFDDTSFLDDQDEFDAWIKKAGVTKDLDVFGEDMMWFDKVVNEDTGVCFFVDDNKFGYFKASLPDGERVDHEKALDELKKWLLEKANIVFDYEPEDGSMTFTCGSEAWKLTRKKSVKLASGKYLYDMIPVMLGNMPSTGILKP